MSRLGSDHSDTDGSTDNELNCALSANETACAMGYPLLIGGVLTGLVGGAWLWLRASGNRKGRVELTRIEGGDSALALHLQPQGLIGRF